MSICFHYIVIQHSEQMSNTRKSEIPLQIGHFQCIASSQICQLSTTHHLTEEKNSVQTERGCNNESNKTPAQSLRKPLWRLCEPPRQQSLLLSPSQMPEVGAWTCVALLDAHFNSQPLILLRYQTLALRGGPGVWGGEDFKSSHVTWESQIQMQFLWAE